MRRILSRGLLLSLIFTAGAAVVPNPTSGWVSGGRANATLEDLESWIHLQVKLTESKMYGNISPANALRGVILASPSKADPNYYYYWIRDGALVMRSVLLLRETTQGTERARHDQAMIDYVHFSRANQIQTGPEAMGEPRFNTDGTINTEPWGRPQNDGPALRALTLMRYARALIAEGKKDFVVKELYNGKFPADSVIKADLEYIGHHWRFKCIDIWEEIWGQHFFTRAVQLAALREGAAFARELGDVGAAGFYEKEANNVEGELAKHWSTQRDYYLATVDSNAGPDHQKPTELDTAVLLGALSAEQAAGPLALTDGKILSTAVKIENAFAVLYAVNKDKKLGTAIGRYTEDYYYGGNPWPLATAAFAELHYKVAKALKAASAFKLESSQLSFFKQAVAGTPGVTLAEGTDLAANENLRLQVIAALIARGDGFMDRIRFHANKDGSLSEQFDRDSGFMRSAYDLTWSYSSFIRATLARDAATTN
jgi:glucoamylase